MTIPPISDPSVKNLADLLDLTVDPTLIIDGSWRIVRANRAMLRLLGRDDALLGRPAAEVCTSPHAFERMRAAFAIGGFLERQQCTCQRQGGEIVTIDMSWSRIGLDHVLIIAREESLARDTLDDARAERANWQSTVSLASGIAHRFNNLLVAITGNVGLLRSNMDDDHPDVVTVEDMELAAREMATLTRHLLAYAGGGKFFSRPTALHDLLDAAIEASGLVGFPSVRVVRRYSPSLPPVDADSGQMKQALVNVLLNAYEAIGDKQGTVEVSTEQVSLDRVSAPVSARSSSLAIRLRIKDNGSGMPEAVRTRVFEPFFTTRAPGRGLGLSAALGIVRSHDGTIAIESRVNEGTTITIDLPAVAGAVEPARRPSIASADGRTRTALVIDDDRGTVRVLKRTLKSHGFHVLVANDGQNAILQAATSAGIDLCVLDMGLPDVSGAELCPKLRAMLPDTPILICTGYGESAPVQQALASGADGFIQKPFEPAEFLERVEQLLTELAQD